jgi:energy-coupling factor transporter ATP-binding protein EcfA2
VDFYNIKTKETRDGSLVVYPDFSVGRSKDLMVRGRSFYAIWDEQRGLWTTDEYDVPRLVDAELKAYADSLNAPCRVLLMRSFDSKIWSGFRNFMTHISDNSHPLDETLVFANSEVTKEDYASRRLPYPLEEGPIDAWNELSSTLYSDEERAKIEWAIGAVISGDAKKIQKFLVLYGPAGSGKSTVLNVIQALFEGYVATFDAKALGSNNNAFATEVFRANPLVAIQHDGDLSRIDDNTKLNSIISHEDMTMNEKYKPSYTARVNAFLFMGTNQPVKISDAKSGIIRRLIDVHPSGHKIETNRYHVLINQVEFELGAIAHHCLKTYREMGRNYYAGYKPLEMMLQTDVFYNYIEAYYDIFRTQDGVTLKQAYSLYKEWCVDTGIEKVLPQYKFREELRNYFERFQDRAAVDGVTVRSYYSGFKSTITGEPEQTMAYSIALEENVSLLDDLLAGELAQYANADGIPSKKWERVDTHLSDLDTTLLHFVKVPENHIVLDFDLTDDHGKKDILLNLEAASKFPPTYAEVSKSGSAVHLHYIYSGDVTDLAAEQLPGIEIKTLLGGSSLRRKLTACNNLPIATISSGLAKREAKMLDHQTIQTERGLRALIDRNIRKEIHPGTKPSMDFIEKILDDAYKSGMVYDVTDLRPVLLQFAARSSNQAPACIKTALGLKYEGQGTGLPPAEETEKPIVFFDVEVYPNLFVVCWKYEGSDEVVKMINPSPQEIEELLSMKLVGFNNRRYDNHILYARFLGYSLKDLYILSSKIVSNDRSCYFGEAYNVSYADIYDFSSVKKGLKRFQIDLGIHHVELDIPWDEPVDESLWLTVVDYCANDVHATEYVFNSRKQDFVARQILAELSGLTVNHTTQAHTARIIFGEEKNPQRSFVYTDLSEEFPGYKYDYGKSTYRDEITGEGGYVYAEPGIYENVAVLDVASMHPTTIEVLNAFGPYTQNFADLKAARIAIKRKDFEAARKMLNGKLVPFLEGDQADSDALSYALKIVINIVYGLTSAKFDNPFRDIRNVDNIVAKRGALFMIDLKHAVQERGFQVVHIKTDSIKIPNATPEIIQFVTEFGVKYGYEFEHENTYEKFCLVNDAVYIAREGDKWTAVGAQFQHPYVYKTLFSGEEVEVADLFEAKTVMQGVMYLDFKDTPAVDTSAMVHIGRTGSFLPVFNGGVLYRVNTVDGELRRYAVTGTKGYLWMERDSIADLESMTLSETFINQAYFEGLRLDAIKTIEKFGSYEDLVAR